MFSRHELVWLTGRGWDAVLQRALAGQHEGIEHWRRENWPAVVRRPDVGLVPGQVSLGIPLPPTPDGVKGRIALNAFEIEVAERRPALALQDAARAAPGQWRPALDALAARLPLQAYGSLAMQAITGQTYLTPSSDIDLLFFPAAAKALHDGLAVLEEHAAALPLDGEIVFPSGAAVAWKEWLNASRNDARVLVKEAGAVRLAPMADLLASLA
ncbi:MAG TPA: malonate decarboxylase holo-[acyl-carrier-protein] synthase [Telluria sp.]|nr:malonate decarboxylase holo-[acyl-carrier-protein] synthase [Telluria sp.]